MAGKKWIQKAHLRKGALHRALGLPERQPIPTALLHTAAKAGGRLARMARAALTLRGLPHR